MVCELEGYSLGCKVIVSSSQESAAVNRNRGLDQCKGDIVIQVDDDISGFYDGWWKDLARPLLFGKDVVMVSARLIRDDGSFAEMLGGCYDKSPGTVSVITKELPSACIAFRNDGTRFDEAYRGSGYEDTDYCAQLRKKYPNGKFLINNKCRLVHRNEQKGQVGENHEHNNAYFAKKWTP